MIAAWVARTESRRSLFRALGRCCGAPGHCGDGGGSWAAVLPGQRRCLSSSSSSTVVKIVEVGPRDGLQNESKIVSVEDKVTLIRKLVEAGCRHIETGSFVSPKWVPTMANTGQVMERLESLSRPNDTVEYSCLVPNLKGLEQALEFTTTTAPSSPSSSFKKIAIFGAASELFSQRNLNCSIEESIERFRGVTDVVHNSHPHILIRGYLSCVFACPYQGRISPLEVAKVAERFFTELNVHELSLGDTIGVGTPGDTSRMLREVLSVVGDDNRHRLAVHFHDTYGQALTNIYVAVQEFGITTVDSSVGGLGGCPYAKGASGNAATEDVVYMFHGMGLDTGIDLEKLVEASDFITTSVLGTTSRSKVARAMVLARQRQQP